MVGGPTSLATRWFKHFACNHHFTSMLFSPSAQKVVYLAIMNIEKKWSMPLHNRGAYFINLLRSLKTDADSKQLLTRLHNNIL